MSDVGNRTLYMSWWNCMPLWPVASYGSNIGGDGLPLRDFLLTHYTGLDD
jgi:hypothetical protein